MRHRDNWQIHPSSRHPSLFWLSLLKMNRTEAAVIFYCCCLHTTRAHCHRFEHFWCLWFTQLLISGPSSAASFWHLFSFIFLPLTYLAASSFFSLIKYVWERLIPGFKHKNFRSREGVCLCLSTTLSTWVISPLKLSLQGKMHKATVYLWSLLGLFYNYLVDETRGTALFVQPFLTHFVRETLVFSAGLILLTVCVTL